MHEDTKRTIVSGWSPLPHLQYQGHPGCFKDSTLWRGNKHSLDSTLGVCGEHALESHPECEECFVNAQGGQEGCGGGFLVSAPNTCGERCSDWDSMGMPHP